MGSPAETEAVASGPRELTDHKINGLNEALTVMALDAPGDGGASHKYTITPKDTTKGNFVVEINFQKRPISEVGVNGVSIEALLAVAIDRLRGFQSGKFACEENGKALDSVRDALAVLQARTKARTTRGVEGKFVP